MGEYFSVYRFMSWLGYVVRSLMWPHYGMVGRVNGIPVPTRANVVLFLASLKVLWRQPSFLHDGYEALFCWVKETEHGSNYWLHIVCSLKCMELKLHSLFMERYLIKYKRTVVILFYLSSTNRQPIWLEKCFCHY